MGLSVSCTSIFSVYKEKLVSLYDILSGQTIFFLRQVSTAVSKSGGHEFLRCYFSIVSTTSTKLVVRTGDTFQQQMPQ